LVEPVVAPYADRGFRLIDLIQEGNMELVRAIEDFDAGRDGIFPPNGQAVVRKPTVTFVTAASTRIREVIKRIVGQ
jgi:hypothetical protein